MSNRFNDRCRKRGSALVMALVLLVSTAGVVYLGVSTSVASVDHSTRIVESSRLQSAATVAADLVATRIWDEFVQAEGGSAGDLNEFRGRLALRAFPPLDPKNPDGYAGSLAVDGAVVDGRPALGAAVAKDGTPNLGGLAVSQLTIQRRDRADRTELEILASVRTGDAAGAAERTVRRVVSVSSAPYSGFKFALLSNNVNCIMCHARIDNAERFYNADKSKHGTFDRIRVGTFESLLVRVGSADSQIAGTVYVRGNITDKDGKVLPDLVGSTVTGNDFDAAGKLLQDAAGKLTDVELTAASGDPPPPFQHLYKDYALDPTEQTDGPMPTSFPPPIPDSDGDKRVDTAEFDVVAADATGTVSGGIIYGVDDGKSYSGKLPTSSNMPEIAGTTTKQVILRGDAANPLILDGTVAINGDVVISGVVKGDGQIIASGNVYVLGDLTYADGKDAAGNRTFGVAADGTKNALAIASGGNVVIGDHAGAKDGSSVTGDGKGSFNFTMSEMMLFNRMEWTYTQKTLPDIKGVQVTNPLYKPGYLPRYYTHGADDPVLIFNKQNPKKKTDHYFDPVSKTWKGKEHLDSYDTTLMSNYPKGTPTYDGAAISSLGTDASWLSESTLRGFVSQVDGFHVSGPLAIDGLLYTNNSTYALVRGTGVYKGKLQVNGSLVAADTGILAPGSSGSIGLRLNYDARLANKLNIKETTAVATMSGALWLPVSADH